MQIGISVPVYISGAMTIGEVPSNHGSFVPGNIIAQINKHGYPKCGFQCSAPNLILDSNTLPPNVSFMEVVDELTVAGLSETTGTHCDAERFDSSMCSTCTPSVELVLLAEIVEPAIEPNSLVLNISTRNCNKAGCALSHVLIISGEI